MKADQIVAALLENDEFDPEEIAHAAGIPKNVTVEYDGNLYPAAFMTVDDYVAAIPVQSVWGTAVKLGKRYVKADVLNMGEGEFLLRYYKPNEVEPERRIVRGDFPILTLFARYSGSDLPVPKIKIAPAPPAPQIKIEATS